MIAIVDASFCADSRMAGVAVYAPDRKAIVAAEVLPAESITVGEGLAAIRACSYLATGRAERGSTIWTDARTLRLRVSSPADRERCEVYAELARMLECNGWELDWRYRGDVAPAHVVARAVLRAWKAGREKGPTWNRTPYLREPA